MFGRRIVLIAATFSLMMLCLSCESEITHKGKTPLVSVDKEFLYKEDVDQLFSTNRPAMDSVAFVNKYVTHWLEDILLYRMARRNVADSKEIERMVDNYRKVLFLNIYQKRLVEQQLAREITEEEIAAFYEQNKEMFVVEEPLIQGLYLKVSKRAPKLSSVRKWYKCNKESDAEELEKYSFTNAIVYEYFMDTWRPLSELAAKMPITASELLVRLKKDDCIEFSDSAYIYFVNSSMLIRKGEQLPLDLASAEISELLINSLKADFIKEVQKSLYDEALMSGEIKFYDDEQSQNLRRILRSGE